MADFPPVGGLPKEHSEFYREEYTDPNIRAEMEGGYILTRSRTGRTPRRIIHTGYKLLTHEQKVALENFQLGRNITALSFTYALPTTGEVISVRFDQTIPFKYIGMGGTHLWKTENIVLREV